MLPKDRIVRLAGAKRCALAHGVKGVNDRRGVIVPKPSIDELGAKKKGLDGSQWEGATDRLMEHVVGFGRIQVLTQNSCREYEV